MSAWMLFGIIAALVIVSAALGVTVVKIAEARGRAAADALAANLAANQAQKVIDVQNLPAPDDDALDRFLRGDHRSR